MMTAEPTMIIVELSNDRSVMIRRCCDKPRPTTGTATHNHNTAMWQSVMHCNSCRTELLVMRWRLPKPVSEAAPLDAV